MSRFKRTRGATAKLGTATAIATLALFTVVPGAQSTDGQPLITGAANSETTVTTIFQGGCASTQTTALSVCSTNGRGLEAFGSVAGVNAQSPTGVGVFGYSSGATGIGVQGKNEGTGSAVYGLANANGVGVFGDTAAGTGVTARATGTGTALNVVGKAKFSRSGIVTVAAGSASRSVALAGVTTASMVLALSQTNSTIFVRSAVPGSGSFTIRLSGAAPTGGLKVAYFVLN